MTMVLSSSRTTAIRWRRMCSACTTPRSQPSLAQRRAWLADFHLLSVQLSLRRVVERQRKNTLRACTAERIIRMLAMGISRNQESTLRQIWRNGRQTAPEEACNACWKSHTNLTHPGKYFRPSKTIYYWPTKCPGRVGHFISLLLGNILCFYLSKTLSS